MEHRQQLFLLGLSAIEQSMPNRQLTPEELERARALLNHIRGHLTEMAGGDLDLLFAYRRKIFKELVYDERGKPMARRKLKQQKFAEQQGVCPVCNSALPDKNAVLDRFSAVDGYTSENTRLIHAGCDQRIQEERRYA